MTKFQFEEIINQIYEETTGQKAFIFGQNHPIGNIYEIVYFFEIICKIESDESWLNLFLEKLETFKDKTSVIQEISNMASEIFDNYSDGFNDSIQDILYEFLTEVKSEQNHEDE